MPGLKLVPSVFDLRLQTSDVACLLLLFLALTNVGTSYFLSGIQLPTSASSCSSSSARPNLSIKYRRSDQIEAHSSWQLGVQLRDIIRTYSRNCNKGNLLLRNFCTEPVVSNRGGMPPAVISLWYFRSISGDISRVIIRQGPGSVRRRCPHHPK